MSVGEGHCLYKSGRKGFKQSAYLQELGCYIGQSVPFDEGSLMLSKLSGISLTDKQIERITHHYGEQIEVVNSNDTALSETTNEERHYAMMDGSMVFIRGQQEGWKELKLARVFAESAAYDQKQRGVIKESKYVAHLGGHDDFLTKFESLIAEKSSIVAISDGARWIWDYWTTFRPDALQILDYFHAIEKIGLWASAVFKEIQYRNDWIENMEKLLLNDEVKEVIIQIQNTDCKADTIYKKEQLITYLTNNQHRMKYKTYIDMGLFIGSGAMESANREVIQKRFKLSGQRWTKTGLQQVANIRIAFKNNQWNQVTNIIKMAA